MVTGIYGYQKQNDVQNDYYPYSTHLVWEHSTYGIYFVRADDQTKLVKTTDEGVTVSAVATLPAKIQAGWLDTNDLHLICCDNPDDSFHHYYYELDNTDNEVDVGEYSTNIDAGTCYTHDIFKHDSDFYACISYEDSGAEKTDLMTITSNPFSIKKNLDSKTYLYMSLFNISGDLVYGFLSDDFTLLTSVGSIDTSSRNGCCYDGSNFYEPDWSNSKIKKYNTSWSYVSEAAVGSNPNSVCWDGTYFYVSRMTGAAPANDSVLYYDASWAYQGGYSPGIRGIYGMDWDGTYFYCVNGSSNVYKYNSSWVLQDTISISDAACGIHYDSTTDTFFITNVSVTDYIYVYDSDFTLINRYSLGSGNDNSCGITSDGNYIWILDNADNKAYKYSFPAIKFIDYNIDTDGLTLTFLMSGRIVPSSLNLRGIAYDGNDVIYYIVYNNLTSTNILYSFVISTTTHTEIGEFNIGLMSDRNTHGASEPFSLERGFGVDSANDLMVFQIPRVYSGSINKIFDLTNNSDLSGASIVAVTDHYLFIKESGGNVELWEFVDSDDYVMESNIVHRVRDYPWAEITYDSGNIYWEEDTFVQIFGTKTSNGVTATDIIFEGHVTTIEDKQGFSTSTKIATLVSPALFDLSLYFPNTTVSSGDTDEHIKELQDDCNYLTEGTISDGGALNNTDYIGGNSFGVLITHFGAFDQFQWYLTPEGAIEYNSGAVDSGVNYTEANTHYIKVEARKIRYNKIKVFGSRASGTQIESDYAEDENLQYEFGIRTLELTIPWIDLKTNADTMAESLLALLKVGITHAEIWVQDSTNGFIQPGEEITFSHTAKGISSAQFKIDQISYDYKTTIAKYIISSEIRYDVDDFREKDTQQLEEQVAQLESYTSGLVEDDAYGAGWNGDTTHAPSQNAVYDMVKDEDDMASDSDVHVATQQSITAYVDSKASVFTGNYTGNGTNDRDLGITFNTISAAWMFDTTSGADMYVKTPEMSGEYAKSFSTFLHVNTRARLTTSNTKIEVSGSLNTNGRIYRYIVFCDV